MQSLFAGRLTGRRVLVTGHTGFKGSWLCHWLTMIGAEVHGMALDPNENQILYDQLSLGQRIASDHRIDIRDRERVITATQSIAPEFVFHMAAQPLVRYSYGAPYETFAVNVMGTAAVLDAVLNLKNSCNVVVVTTDKCYENREWEHAYRESDPMGGHDPYSASKGCAELVTSAYRRSFAAQQTPPIRIASARAGNVIGGGDWATGRIVPDMFRALDRGDPITIRNRVATRPWQHVLEPLSGYLWLAAMLDGCGKELSPPVSAARCCQAFNFGPSLSSNRTVEQLIQEFAKHTPIQMVDDRSPDPMHEAEQLNLSIDRAFHRIKWRPVWDFETAVRWTARYYSEIADPTGSLNRTNTSAIEFIQRQIECYRDDAVDIGLIWAGEHSA